mgnify:CR=1 FL=1
MESRSLNINRNLDQEMLDFFSKVEIPYENSKEDVWNQLSTKLNENPKAPKEFWLGPKLITAIAAGLLILFSVVSITRFYTKTITVPSGKHVTALLPDGSSVELNAESKLVYHPYWWRFERKVGFEGEGFFKVERGKKFEVNSEQGKTIVLGTSFNIYNREQNYKVTCVTGKVKVISTTNKEVILSPDYKAEVDANGDIKVYKEKESKQSISWVNNMFNFTSVPLGSVLEEIERQYDITIYNSIEKDYFYTGFFSRDKNAEEVLNLLAKTFGFTFVKRSDKVYEIIQSDVE